MSKEEFINNYIEKYIETESNYNSKIRLIDNLICTLEDNLYRTLTKTKNCYTTLSACIFTRFAMRKQNSVWSIA